MDTYDLNVSDEMFAAYIHTGAETTIIKGIERIYSHGIDAITYYLVHRNGDINTILFAQNDDNTNSRINSSELPDFNYLTYHFLSDYGKICITRLLQIDGIIEVKFTNSNIIIYKCHAFSWDQIKPNIVNAFSGHKFIKPHYNDILQSTVMKEIEWDCTFGLLISRVRLTRNGVITNPYYGNNSNNWKRHNFMRLTRKGKKFVSLLKQYFKKDFNRLKLKDYRIWFMPSTNIRSNDEYDIFCDNLVNVCNSIITEICSDQ